MTTFVLLSSPFLGPAAWQPVAQRLGDLGARVVVPAGGAGARTPADVLAGWRRELPVTLGPVVLVPYSNAGLYVAALCADPEVAEVEGLVLVDALLPSDEPVTPTAPPDFRDQVAPLADEHGVLPPWTRWWPEEDVDALFPDAATRARVEREQPRLPLAYLDDRVPTPAGWERLPAAYVGFGDTYAAEQDEARRRGWPVRRLPGEHLHLVVDPVAVADAVLQANRSGRAGSRTD